MEQPVCKQVGAILGGCADDAEESRGHRWCAILSGWWWELGGVGGSWEGWVGSVSTFAASRAFRCHTEGFSHTYVGDLAKVSMLHSFLAKS